MKKKIAIYIGALGSGGIESCTVTQFKRLDNNQFDVDFIVHKEPQRNHYYYEIIKHGGRVIALINDNNKGGYKISKLISLYHCVKENKYNAFHLHISDPTSLFYLLIVKLAFWKCVTLATSHAQGTAKKSIKTKIMNDMSRLLFPSLCNYRFCDSDLAGKWMFGPYSFKTIINGIDVASYSYNPRIRSEIRRELSMRVSDFVIGHVGRFEIDKNHKFIIEVFEEFHKRCPESKLLLIGDGSLHKTIEAMAFEKCLNDSVVYVLNTPNVNKYLSAMDLFIFPSFREGFGLVAIEAQAASLPVLASTTIPRETQQTNCIFYEDLAQGAAYWSQAIMNIRGKKIDRTSVDLSNLYANCDIDNLTKEMSKLYD